MTPSPIRTIHRAIELGMNLIDTAEVYGPFINETLVGQAIQVAAIRWSWRPSSA